LPGPRRSAARVPWSERSSGRRAQRAAMVNVAELPSLAASAGDRAEAADA